MLRFLIHRKETLPGSLQSAPVFNQHNDETSCHAGFKSSREGCSKEQCTSGFPTDQWHAGVAGCFCKTQHGHGSKLWFCRKGRWL